MKKVSQYCVTRTASLHVFALILIAMWSSQAVAQNSNGIQVTEAKVYDERTLTIMLEQLNEQLRTITFVDRTKLAAQLGLLQGFQSKELSRSLDVGMLPIPGLDTTRKPDADGNLAVSEQTESRAAFTPKAPGLPSIMTPPKFEPVIGANASDLLDEQVNLTYQIFNLRMMLEKSLTDRLWSNERGTTPRLIAVIGFDIEVHAPKDAHDRAAYVEIKITPKDGKYPAPSLIALMPQEKTYNSAALSSKSTAFGGSAVAKIITVGYSEQRRGQTFYLFRDSDTATLTYAPKNGDKVLKFGWVFHPVLGQRAVAPNKRHMFAVIALPEGDNDSVSFAAKVDARTYWRKYDRNKLTNGTEDLFNEPFTISESLTIPNTKQIQSSLKPKIDSVKWYATDEKSVVVTVEGDNFFTGTNVFLGSTNYDEGAGNLLIKSSKSLQVKTTVPALTSGEDVVNGRYGTSVPLYINDAYSRVVPKGIALSEFSFRPPQPGRKFVSLSLRLRNRDVEQGLRVDQLPPKETLILSVEKTPVAQPYVLEDVDCNSGSLDNIRKHCVEVNALVPAELVAKEAIVSFKYPFRGPDWADSGLNYTPAEVGDVLRLGVEDKITKLAVTGRGFDDEWQIRLDQNYKPKSEALERIGETLMILKINTDTLEKYKSLILLPRPYSDPIIKAIPSAKPPAPEPKLADGQNAVVTQDTAPSVEFKGSDLSAVTKVTFEGRVLERKVAKDGKSISVFLTRRVTAKIGPAQLLLWAGETILPATVTVQEKK